MGHRPLSNSMEMSEIDQDLYQSRGTAEQSYIHMGRGATPENGSVVYPMENTQNGIYCSPYQNLEYRPVQHSLLSARMEGPQFRAADSGASYDPFLHSPAPGSSYMVPENSAGHAHMSYYNSHTTQEVESALLDPTMGTGRNPFKRKSPDLSLGCETGSTSRFYATGSSSSSSESQPEKSTSDYRNFSSSSIGLPPYRGGNFPFGSEDALRNVRSRSRLDVDPMGRSYISNQSFHHYRPMTHLTSHSGTVDITNINADINTHDQNHVIPPPAAHRRLPTSETIGINHEMNQFLVGGRTLDTDRLHRDSLAIRNPVSPPQYPSGIHPQIVSEGRGNYSRRAMSSYRASPSCTQLGHEAARSENGLQFLSETHSSRYLRPSSARGWCNNHLDGRSRISSERFESLSNAGEAHDRMGPEALMMVDHPPIYGSRNLLDQYRDMRLDVDNMSYEELLALGERIGNVSTGLSENFISKCLVEMFGNVRQVYEWKGLKLEVDETDFGFGTLYEIECESENPEDAKKLLEEFLKDHGINYSYSEKSKFAIFRSGKLPYLFIQLENR